MGPQCRVLSFTALRETACAPVMRPVHPGSLLLPVPCLQLSPANHQCASLAARELTCTVTLRIFWFIWAVFAAGICESPSPTDELAQLYQLWAFVCVSHPESPGNQGRDYRKQSYYPAWALCLLIFRFHGDSDSRSRAVSYLQHIRHRLSSDLGPWGEGSRGVRGAMG